MASGSQIQSLGKLLYTQNPFYLISCFLVIYGIQITAMSDGDLVTRSCVMTASLAAYTLLMAITCVGVVRLGKVWEDARSILFVVIIAEVALSTGLDELCITNWNLGATLLAATGIFACLITEGVLRGCGLRFPSWYRLSFYALQLIFFGTPIVLGRAVGQRDLALTNWGAPLFSVLIAGALLLLVPAVRRRNAIVRHNGTPWRWPLYPLSAFAILVVLAGIRSHAVWMSFGFIGASVRFEPLLLLPIAFAILILMVESDHRRSNRTHTVIAMVVAPFLFIGGVSRDGLTHLPIRSDLQMYFGSAETITLWVILVFYLYTWLRGAAGSKACVTGSLLALSFLGVIPTFAASAGFQPWMYGAVASLVMLSGCLSRRSTDLQWVAFISVVVVTLLTAGRDHDQVIDAMIASSVVGLTAMLLIGAIFRTEFAVLLRRVAAGWMMMAAAGIVGWHVSQAPGIIVYGILGALVLVAIVYLQIVKRLGWLYVIGVQVAGLAAVLTWSTYEAGSLGSVNWPIQTGLICFVIGLSISSAKTGAHRKWRCLFPRESPRRRYKRGF